MIAGLPHLPSSASQASLPFKSNRFDPYNMGNCCGSQAVDDSPSAPVRATRTQPIARATGPGQTLGGPSGGPVDPRTAAAIAAEVCTPAWCS